VFDRIVIVDWSAENRPKRGRDSIWIAVLDVDVVSDGLAVVNPPTRAAASRHLDAVLDERPDAATLIGVDFSLGYPAGTAAALGLRGVPWSAMWDLIDRCVVDDAQNANNRFDVAATFNATMTGRPAPFWGCPASARSATLASTKPLEGGPVHQWRTVEDVLRSAGHRPFSSWQLLGAGAVGSQSLVGIPIVRRLLTRTDRPAAIWPFTTGLSSPRVEPGTVTVVEVWPALFALDRSEGRVRDEAQVVALARRLADVDRIGELHRWFAPEVAEDRVETVRAEEGWVLGVPALCGAGHG
jgi:hypothetical protein